MKVIVVKTDNSIEVKYLQGNLTDTIKEILDGNPTPVKSRAEGDSSLMLSETCLLCLEEGFFKDKRINLFGSILYNGKLSPFMKPIVGDVMLVGEGAQGHRGLWDNEVGHYLNVLAAIKQFSLNFLDSVR